jgi:rhamnose utilization protein RhaD (predicted bifunctional aldolase and dehydrogenase)
MSDDILKQLIDLSNDLGRPELDYVMLGEGNTSARTDADSFYVKVSGAELRTATARGFVRVKFKPVIALLDMPHLEDSQIKAALTAAKMDPADPGHPSIETLLHAICLSLPGVDWVGHTHPTAINALTCSTSFEQAFGGRVFPDEIVLCGPASVLVPYADPGVPLARAVAAGIEAFVRDHGEQPRVIVLQNHGLIALGRTAQQVEEITRMAVKAARIRLGTYSAGGPRFLSQRDVDRIHTRPDEEFRRKQLGLDLRGTEG